MTPITIVMVIREEPVDHSELTVGQFLEKAVAEVPDEPLLLWDERQISYREFDEQANRAANVWHHLGVRRGDRVAFMVDNKPELLYAWFGLAKLGATLVAINTGFREQETRYILEHSQAKFVLVDDGYTEIVESAVEELPGLEAGYCIQASGGFPHFGELVDRAGTAAPATDVQPDDVVSFIYTSGTTGNPKAVMQSHKNFVLTGQAYPSWMRMERGDRIYACLPLFHVNSQAYSMMGAIGARGAIVLAPRFSAGRFWDDIRKNKVAVFNFIGAMTLILSKKPPADDDREHHVKVAYGVPALPGELRESLEKRYGMTVISGFGMSETTFGLLEPYDERRTAGAMGFPRHHPDPSVPRTEAAVVDEDGNMLGDNEVGELILRGPAHMLGYFHDPEKTAEALRDGWLYTGDMARRDTDGQYYFVDRKKDIVRRRGENVSSLEVENVINDHPSVLESAVIGVPSELTDEDLMVFIVARDGSELNFGDIGDWAAERLARFKVPRYYRQIDSLPKTSTQKIAKHQLRASVDDPSNGYDRDLAATAR
ncbi:AMP-binding protein [Mycolicibacterium iranicum]|uniref:AMP-binding protein n=1 Tax=Mycolicibacterium iranicum TaxID=912594 RepID=UPI000AE67F61|nr:AMP-binding protein [Mycolicibacterium iranicum]